MSKTRLTLLLGAFSEGGAEHMVYELARCIDKTRFDVQALCYGPQLHTALEQKMGQACPITWLDRDGKVTVGTIICVLKALRRLQPDVVHAHMAGVGFGAIWALLFGKRFVATAHTKPEQAFSSKNEKLLRLALKRRKTTLVAVSKENRSLLQTYFNIGSPQLDCVNNGIDLARFARKEHEGFTVIHVGRQDENKNQAALVRCFARLHEQNPNTKLLLLGDGDQHQVLKDLVAQLKLQDAVTFTGNVPNTEDYYAVSDMYVQCSHREAMPLSVLEAMAAGLPIVATNVGGLCDVVKENGRLVADGDEDALYCAMRELYELSPEKRTQMGDKSLELVQSYSSENMARQYEAVYLRLMRKKK